MQKHRGDYASLVLPEVLKNPVAFFKKANGEKNLPKLVADLVKNLDKKPQIPFKYGSKIKNKSINKVKLNFKRKK